jgi:hypothetical protein
LAALEPEPENLILELVDLEPEAAGVAVHYNYKDSDT